MRLLTRYSAINSCLRRVDVGVVVLRRVDVGVVVRVDRGQYSPPQRHPNPRSSRSHYRAPLVPVSDPALPALNSSTPHPHHVISHRPEPFVDLTVR